MPPSYFSAPQRHCGRIWLEWDGASRLKFGPIRRSALQLLFAGIRIWIDKASAALLRIEGYDRQGKLAKRFEVVSAQKIDGQWMLKQMRVERIDPATRKTTGITYLEVLGSRIVGS